MFASAEELLGSEGARVNVKLHEAHESLQGYDYETACLNNSDSRTSQ